MFDNSRYMTMGVKNEIPTELQLFMWDCINKLNEQEKELDYLQVFELQKIRFNDFEYQRIEHRQEVPKYKRIYNIFPAEMVDAKVFIIDDGSYSTMMLAEEY